MSTGQWICAVALGVVAVPFALALLWAGIVGTVRRFGRRGQR